jgi:Asp/Glu/hydantoin racemase
VSAVQSTLTYVDPDAIDVVIELGCAGLADILMVLDGVVDVPSYTADVVSENPYLLCATSLKLYELPTV